MELTKIVRTTMRLWYGFLLILFVIGVTFFVLGGGFNFSDYSLIAMFIFALLLAIIMLYLARWKKRWWES